MRARERTASLTPTHPYRPTVIEAKALAFMGDGYIASSHRLADAYAMAADDEARRDVYTLGHRLYHDAVRYARQQSNCPRDIAQPWKVQPWVEPVKGGQ
jgi:hypothetical protein